MLLLLLLKRRIGNAGQERGLMKGRGGGERRGNCGGGENEGNCGEAETNVKQAEYNIVVI